MAELESRLAAQTTETEKLKVCRISVFTICLYECEACITSQQLSSYLSLYLPSTPTSCYCSCPLTCSSPVLSLFLIGSGGDKEVVGESGRPGAAAGFSHQYSGHPADGENKAANRGSRVQEGAGRPSDAAGRPGPEDPHSQTETQKPGRDGRRTLPSSLTHTALNLFQ